MPRPNPRACLLATMFACLVPQVGTADEPGELPQPVVAGPARTNVGRWEPVVDHPLLGSVPPFRTTELAAEPTDGGLRPSRGYAHYDLPSRHYGIWFRPTAFGRQDAERCRPIRFNPRGFGHLFAKSSVPYRMEYDPFVLTNERNSYGPSYMVDYHHCRCGLPRLFCRKCRCQNSGEVYGAGGWVEADCGPSGR